MHENESPQFPQSPYSPSGASGAPSNTPRPAPSRGFQLSWAVWLLLLLIGLLVLPSFVERIQYSIAHGRQRAEAEVARELLTDISEEAAKGGVPLAVAAYRHVAKAIEPSVVGVKATQIRGGRSDELSSLLFGRTPQFRSQDQGSGVIVDETGYVLTNYHVVGRSRDVSVELSDGRRYKARIVGIDPATDLAVLKINGDNLIAAPLGDSDALEVGDPVMAIGNPFGLARTVTSGIVSAKGRRAVIENVNYQDFLQTDAAVNPGNSGGPLVNMKAQVIGINTAIVGPTYQGISFAIPSNLVKRVYEQLKTSGKVARGWLGVATQPLTPELAEKLGVENTQGALVTDIVPGSPAEHAGLRPGDVILAWNDTPIRDPGGLGLTVASTPIGSKATVKFFRDGEEKSLTVNVTERPERLE